MWRLTVTAFDVVILLSISTLQLPTLAGRSAAAPPLHSDDRPRPGHGYNDDNIADEWREIFANEFGELVSRDHDGVSFSGKLDVVDDWPNGELRLGQVAGVATDTHGHVHVFHRANRPWDSRSFDANNTYRHADQGPIKMSTVFTLNVSNGVVLNRRADNFFYLPHGLTVDSDGNFWMTDVAMHQVFKFSPGNRFSQPMLTLGRRFEAAASNDDTTRFCKPTDVAVTSTGDFFIADGYCASRVLKFDKHGQLIGQFGIDDFHIPHSLALAEDLDLVCVADRENMRVLCYNAGIQDPRQLGEPLREYADELLGRVFAVTYSSIDGLLYGITGPTGVLVPQGFTIDLLEDEHYSVDLIATWSPDDKGFNEPHDLAVTPDGEAVFVGETSPDVLWKFVKERVQL